MLFLLQLAIVQGFQNSLCLEPLPVAHAFRRWIPDADPNYGRIRYDCVDGYQATMRSTSRSCQMLSQNVYGYSEIAPVCELTCGEARNISAAAKTWNSTMEGGRTSYSCFADYGSDVAFVDCSPALDRWTHILLYCKASLDLRNATATQDPSNNKTSSTASLAIDTDPNTCSATKTATRTQLNVTLSDFLVDIMTVKLILKMDSTDTQVIIRAEVGGGQLSRCDWANVSQAEAVNNTVTVKLQCTGTPNKPFGNVLVLSASFGAAQGRLQICDLDVKGRRHLGTCHFPPRIYPLRLVDNGLTSFVFGDTLLYECEDGFTPVNGSGETLCDVDSQWTSPTLQCTDEVDRTATATPNITSEDSGWRAVVTLETQLEMYGVYVAKKGNVTVSITSLEGQSRSCADTQESDYGVFVLCERRPLAKTISVSLPQANKLRKSDIKVFGRPFQGALECLQTPSGADYKGQLNVTKSGFSCLPWKSVSNSPYTKEMFSDDVLKTGGNFCRNPRGEQASPWCFVNERGLITENCDLFMCEEFCKVRPDGTDYKGNQTVTASAKPCMNWSDPALPFRRETYFPDLDLNHTKCRNPAASQTAPWCYVTNRDHIVSDIEAVNTTLTLPYDLCDIANCPTNVSFIYLAQDTVASSPYVAITKECNGDNIRHFRLGLVKFVRRMCMNTNNRTSTSLCLFQDRSQNRLWAFVIISCQDSPTVSVTSSTFTVETFTSSQPQATSFQTTSFQTQATSFQQQATSFQQQATSFPSSQRGTVSPTPAAATPSQLLSFAVSAADERMRSLGIDYSTSEASSALTAETNYLFSKPNSMPSAVDVSCLGVCLTSSVSTTKTAMLHDSLEPSVLPTILTVFRSTPPMLGQSIVTMAAVVPTRTIFKTEESEARINLKTSTNKELEDFAMNTLFLAETDLHTSLLAISTFYEDSNSFFEKSSHAVGSDTSVENVELADWSQPNDSLTFDPTNSSVSFVESVWSSFLDFSEKSSSALPSASDSEAVLSSSPPIPGCRGKCRCTFLQTTSSADLNDLESFTRSVQQNLMLNVSTLSHRRRKLTSAYDSRISAMAVGSFAVGLLIFTCLVVSASDIVHLSVLAIAILKRTQQDT